MGNVIFRDAKILRSGNKIILSKSIKTAYGQASPSLVEGSYFGYGGILKRYTGTTWVKAKLRTYVGQIQGWMGKSLKIYKDGKWQNVETI